MSATVLDKFVLSKPYFDREGLIVAEEDERLLGFVHAGFGPAPDLQSLTGEPGVINMLLVVPGPNWNSVASDLLRQAETYLANRGSRTAQTMSVLPTSPFYFGLYGGSDLRGVLQSDIQLLEFFKQNRYEQQERWTVLQRDLKEFRPPVCRAQMAIRRSYHIESRAGVTTHNWWEACTLGGVDRTMFSMSLNTTGQLAATATFWDGEPLTSSRQAPVTGLLDCQVAEPLRKQGLGTYLVAESLRQLRAQKFSVAEAQVSTQNAAAMRLLNKLGFREIDQTVLLRKQIGST
ncbi:MAG: hypothetical protein CMJ81_14005 [Planctomycetaceae bacterium]|jgi:GNAT superfamily N-acetyltransferase|nr:hypothetical protein [Planctomycetaceae bacterium]